jgi:hypothetical protein
MSSTVDDKEMLIFVEDFEAKVYHIEGTMQNTQSGWTEKHK